MTEQYKLADGSLLGEYREGDKFNCIYGLVEIYHIIDGCDSVLVTGNNNEPVLLFKWNDLKPTIETQQNVTQRRSRKNLLNRVYTARDFNFFGVKQEPLARIVDWRGGEEIYDTDVIVSDAGETWCRDNFFYDSNCDLGEKGWNIVIRINTDALPKQRTLTKAEAEKELNARITD